MDTIDLVGVVVFGAFAFVLISVWDRWSTKRLSDGLVAELIARATTADGRPVLRSKDGQTTLAPEYEVVVDVSDTGTVCSRPDGATESVEWSDLQRVEVFTTADGPFVPDMFWVLYGSSGGCVIPWGATGEEQLLSRLQALPDFRHDVIVNAASLTTNNQLLCWERTPQNT